MNLPEILALKFPGIDFDSECILADHGLGNGPEISQWNRVETKPTQKDLDKWAIELEIEYQKKLVLEKRKESYPAIEDQLDMLYHDMINSTNLWVETITQIKQDNPLPEENK